MFHEFSNINLTHTQELLFITTTTKKTQFTKLILAIPELIYESRNDNPAGNDEEKTNIKPNSH